MNCVELSEIFLESSGTTVEHTEKVLELPTISIV